VIAARFAEQLSKDGSRLAVQTTRQAHSYTDLVTLAEELRASLTCNPGQIVGLAGGLLATRIAALLAIESRGATACLLPSSLSQADQARWAMQLPLAQTMNLDSLSSTESLTAGPASFPWLTEHHSEPNTEDHVWLFTGRHWPPRSAMPRAINTAAGSWPMIPVVLPECSFGSKPC